MNDEINVDFCLNNQDGKEMCMNDFQNRWLVLYFYPKDNTPGCSLEAQAFSQKVDEFKKLNAEIIGVSADSVESHKNFEEKKGIKFNLLSDSEKKLLKDFDVWKPKKMFGKEFMGIQRSTFLINPDKKIAYEWRKVKVAGHIDDVKNKLEELQKEE